MFCVKWVFVKSSCDKGVGKSELYKKILRL